MKNVRLFLPLSSALILGVFLSQPLQGQSLPSGPTPIVTQPMEPVQIRPVSPRGREHFPGEPPEMQPVVRKKPLDLVAARKEAHELADTAGRVSGQIDMISKNTLPKDLIQQLKQVEKLAKTLRKQIEP